MLSTAGLALRPALSERVRVLEALAAMVEQLALADEAHSPPPYRRSSAYNTSAIFANEQNSPALQRNVSV